MTEADLDLLNLPRLDKQSVKRSFNRAASSYDKTAVLQAEVLSRLLERLQYIKHKPASILDVGCGTGKGIRGLQKHYPGARVHAMDIAHQMLLEASRQYRWWSKKPRVVADMESLPFRAASFDMLFSSLALQWSNDLKQSLNELARVGKPGGLLMFATLGPMTLNELDQAWRDIDNQPRVHDFIDMHDVGDAMVQAGFAQPVVDAETIRMEYQSFSELLGDIKGIGASNAALSRSRGLMTPRRLRKLEDAYKAYGFESNKFLASYEVVYGHAWLSDMPKMGTVSP